MNKSEVENAERIALDKYKELVKDHSVYTTDQHALLMAKFLSNVHREIQNHWIQAFKKYLYKV